VENRHENVTANLLSKSVVEPDQQTVYQLRHGLPSDYLRQQLRYPTIAFS